MSGTKESEEPIRAISFQDGEDYGIGIAALNKYIQDIERFEQRLGETKLPQSTIESASELFRIGFRKNYDDAIRIEDKYISNKFLGERFILRAEHYLREFDKIHSKLCRLVAYEDNAEFDRIKAQETANAS